MMKRALLCMGTLALVAGVSGRAEAAMFMSISDGGTPVTCTIGGACAAGFTTSGNDIINFSGTVGGYSISTLGESSNNPGTPGGATLNSSTTSVTNTTDTGTLTILLSQTGFTAPAGPVGMLSNSGGDTVTGSSAGDTYTLESWVDTTNAAHTTTPVSGTQSAGPCSLSGAFVGPKSNSCTTDTEGFTNATPFSLTQVVTFKIAAGDGAIFDSTGGTTVTAPVNIPEPASMLLLGTGLVGLAARARRRTSKR